MLATYPALFYYDESESEHYFIHFPNFKNSATQGVDISDAMHMASDWLGITLSSLIEAGTTLPSPTPINSLSLIDDDPFKDDNNFSTRYNLQKSFVSMVSVDVTKYLRDEEPVKKTLTIPRWADVAGKKMRINFSQTLTDAIAEKTSSGKNELGI